jgi:heme/copper-type cytochrome/quinol oxidase subunit 2
MDNTPVYSRPKMSLNDILAESNKDMKERLIKEKKKDLKSIAISVGLIVISIIIIIIIVTVKMDSNSITALTIISAILFVGNIFILALLSIPNYRESQKQLKEYKP